MSGASPELSLADPTMDIVVKSFEGMVCMRLSACFSCSFAVKHII